MAFCINCGTQQLEGANFCSACGQPAATVGSQTGHSPVAKDLISGACSDGHANDSSRRYCLTCDRQIVSHEGSAPIVSPESERLLADRVAQAGNDFDGRAGYEYRYSLLRAGYVMSELLAQDPTFEDGILTTQALVRGNAAQIPTVLSFALSSRTTLREASRALFLSGWDENSAWNLLVKEHLTNLFVWPPTKTFTFLTCTNGHANLEAWVCELCSAGVSQPLAPAANPALREAALASEPTAIKYLNRVLDKAEKKNEEKNVSVIVPKIVECLTYLSSDLDKDSDDAQQKGLFGFGSQGFSMDFARILESINWDVETAKQILLFAVMCRITVFNAWKYHRRNPGGDWSTVLNEVISDGIFGTADWSNVLTDAEAERLDLARENASTVTSIPGVLKCPHCQASGTVSRKSVKQKQGISGGKATAALLTMGTSVLVTGLSRKTQVTELHCNACGMTWIV